MKTPVTASFALAAAFSLSLSVAHAKEQWRYEIDKRQDRHAELIVEGRSNGALTWREVRILKSEQRRIDRMKRGFLADGVLDWNERQTLRYAQDAANTHIFEARNNADRKFRW